MGVKRTKLGPVESPESLRVPLEDVFVSLDIEANVAYLVCETTSGLRWKELSRADAEFLAAMGTRSRIRLGSTWTAVTSSDDLADEVSGKGAS
jgi:hypothetical protein